jgi:Undecaprenyl-phosphate galactose phosphotransferase WbaP
LELSRLMHRRFSTPLVLLLLALSDLLGFYLSFLGAIALRRALEPWLGGTVKWAAAYPLIWVGMLLMLSMFWAAQLYPGYGLTAVRELESVVKALTLVFVFLALVAYLLKVQEIKEFSRLTFLFAWGLSLLLLPLLRFLLRNRLSLTAWYGLPTMLVSPGETEFSNVLLDSLYRCRRLGWRPVAILNSATGPGGAPTKGLARLASLQQLEKLSQPIAVALVVLPASGSRSPKKTRAEIQQLTPWVKRIVLFDESQGLNSVFVEPRDLEGLLGLEIHYRLLEPRYIRFKRLLEVLLAGLLLLVSLPLQALLALWVRLDSPGPILHRQSRLGKGGQLFQVLKFRSMNRDAEERLEALLASDPVAREEYQTYHKLGRDPRLTRAGFWLRKYSLDELPQLWNVLRGEMNLIGPRAYLPSELEAMGHYADTTLSIAPGITGWWQVMGRHQTTFAQRLQMDEYYLSNWSPWMDFYITLKTLWIILSGQGV